MGVNGVGSGWTAIGPSAVDVSGIESGWMNVAENGCVSVGATLEVIAWVGMAECGWVSVGATLDVIM